MKEAGSYESPGLREIEWERQRTPKAEQHSCGDFPNAEQHVENSAALRSNGRATVERKQQTDAVDKAARAENDVSDGCVGGQILAQRAAHGRHRERQARATLVATRRGGTNKCAACGTQTRAAALLLPRTKNGGEVLTKSLNFPTPTKRKLQWFPCGDFAAFL